MTTTLAPTKPPINLAPPGSLSHLQWRATEWLYAFGPLRPEIALDYFALSPFYDRGSNNEELKMQMNFARGGMEGVGVNDELKRFRGLQYKLEYAAPPGLFIIHRQQRTSESQAETTGVYYILNDNVYQGPTLYTVLNERMLTAIHHMTKSINLIQDRKPTWTPTTAYDWDIKQPSTSSLPTATSAADTTATTDPTTDPTAGPSAPGTIPDIPIIDDDAEIPASTFNPLLYRALTGLATTLTPPPGQADPPGQDAAGPSGAAEGAMEGIAETNGATPADDGKSGTKPVRVGPKGLRKPKGAV